ncbi:Leucine-rich receptor-like protein kinase family protein [Rhynchospora pubera]|uniref:Leucine-rich receptor-like protein kinase family protein n=1 Tax=Rhynchospora pubera TaxID=906938 RepID=A0AAV8HY67_9POAL|nr:Leucine-rich receptor-like protein kinase family protein [Rhynchospora pubera]
MASSSLLPSSFLLFLSLLSLLPLSLSQQTQTSSEAQTLLQIKHDWGNPAVLASWTNSNASSYCNWTGVGCSDGAVTSLVLFSSNITGSVPSSICQLKSLSTLDLYNNNITGSFPRFLLNCTNLQYLDLSYNMFIGELPSDINMVLPNITFLSLSQNNFTGKIPTSIGTMTQLQSLLLDNNLFIGTMPSFISKLTNLQQLALAWNSFTPGPIPEEYGTLTNLTYLFIAAAHLEGKIPDSFANLTQLVQFDLSINSLQGTIPPGIWSFSNLKYLYLYKNNLSGEITINNPFGAHSLVAIDLTKNQLTGPIPESFGTLQNLSILFLSYNKLSGQIPEGIGLLPKLTDVRLFYNNLTGILPPELGKHSPLWNLEVFNNMLSGEIPADICYNGAFTSLGVSNNNMTGSIPQSLGNCSHLDSLQVDNNHFTGDVPAGVWKMQNVTIILMSNNMLSGNLPSRLPWNLSRLEIVNNQFSGSIPSSSSNILVFKAGGNKFTGDIPSSLSTGMPLLQTLDLSENRISGEIPASIGSLGSLSVLNLSHNKISGEIPASIGSMAVLTSLDLSSNELSGEIPSAFGNVKFNFLNLSSNDLSGKIPSGIDISAYDESFLSNPGLCSSASLNGISRCRAGANNGISHGLRSLFIALGVIILVIIVIFALCVMRDYHRRKAASDPAMWKLTSFHRLDFTEDSIIRGMTKENLIGSGGAGQVYRVTLGTHTGDVVAVKKIYSKGKLSTKLDSEFDSEVKILGSIRHSNIVKLLCCISSPDSKLLVYEYMENSSLDKWLHDKRRVSMGPLEAPTGSLDWPTRLQIAIGAARGLCYMHHECAPPVVHRDVKSSNILLDSEFDAKIADFGLARMLMKIDEPETVSAVAGSFGYMAPECAFSRKVNEKVDVYSFGVVLLELTTGREAHDGGDYGSLADWAWWNVQEGNTLYNCLAKEIRETPYLDEIEVVFKLGLICTGKVPSTRPTMKDVLDVLLRYDVLNQGPSGNKKLKEHDENPLLGNKNNDDSCNSLFCDV